MKRKFSNILSKTWLSLVLLSMVLAACAQPTGVVTPEASGQNTPKPGNGNAPATPEPGAGDEDEHAVITFAGDEYLRAQYEPLIEEFNKLYPNITVQFAVVPQYTDDKQDLFANYQRLMAVTGDTSITWLAGSVGNEQYFLDLLPLMEGDPTFDPGDFWDGALEACQDLEGRSLGIPTTIQVTGLFYNDEAFAEAGVPAPRPGWTWDDFREAVVAMTKVEAGRTRYGYAEQSNSVLAPLIDNALILADGEVNPQQIQQEFQWYLDLAKQGAIFPPPYAEDEQGWNDIWQKWNEMFTSPQRPAMWVGGLAEQLPGAEWVNDESDPWANSAINIDGYAPFPVSAENPSQKTSIAYTQCLSVSKGTRYPRAAWTWINFLSQQWTNKGKTFAWDLLQIPARRSTIEANNYWDLLPEKAVPALEFALNHAWYSPGFYWMESNTIISALSKSAAGYGDFASALADFQAQITPTPEPTPDTAPVVVNTPLPTVSPDATVVKYFANAWGEELETLNALAQQYADEHPDIAIKITTQIDTQDDWYLAVTDQFDCFSWYTLDWKTQSPANLLPLDSLLEAEGPEFSKDFNPNLFKTFTFEGNLYGLPIASDFMMMGYNKTLLEKKGIKLPSNEWTFEDFANMLEQVGGGEGSERTYGYQMDEWDDSLFLGKGVRWADLEADPPVPMINSPDMVTFVTWLLQLKESGGIFVQNQDNYMEFDEAMRDGRIAFYRTNASQPQGWYYYGQEAPFEMGVAPFPQFNDPTGMFFMGTTRAHMISKNSQNVQACWDWITFLSEQTVLLQGVPARTSVLESPEWEAVIGKENAAAMRAAMNNLQPQVTSYEYNPLQWPLQTWRGEAVRKALAGEDITEVLNAAQQKSETFLECMKGVDTTISQDQEKLIALDEKIRACGLQADPDGDMWQPVVQPAVAVP